MSVLYIFKLFRIEEWLQFEALGKTDGAPIDIMDGFIHFSKASQVKETAAKHFKADKDLILLSCKAEHFKSDLKWEISRGGELFPHLYRKLALADIEARYDIPKINGLHNFPDIISRTLLKVQV